MAEKTLMEKVQEANVGVQPTTALGAQSLGATPQQAAMAGTGAVKKRVLKEQTLSGVQRLAQPSAATASPEIEGAAAKAKRIQEVGGSLAGRMESAIEKQISKVLLERASLEYLTLRHGLSEVLK